MKKWQEVDFNFWREIYSQYFYHKEIAAGKVIEFQVVPLLFGKDTGEFVRVFLGFGIDLPEYRKRASNDLPPGFPKVPEINERDFGLTMCTTDDRGGINFKVLGYPEPYCNVLSDIIWYAHFGSPLSDSLKKPGMPGPPPIAPLWYCKNKAGKILIPDNNNFKPGCKRYVRIRILDLDYWRSMTDYFLKTKKYPGEFFEDDLDAKVLVKID